MWALGCGNNPNPGKEPATSLAPLLLAAYNNRIPCSLVVAAGRCSLLSFALLKQFFSLKSFRREILWTRSSVRTSFDRDTNRRDYPLPGLRSQDTSPATPVSIAGNKNACIAGNAKCLHCLMRIALYFLVFFKAMHMEMPTWQ